MRSARQVGAQGEQSEGRGDGRTDGDSADRPGGAPAGEDGRGRDGDPYGHLTES
ncbi:hypothetical protein ACR820_05020 [Streptomyces netropsis]